MIIDECNLEQNIDCRYYVPEEFNPTSAQGSHQTQCLTFLHCNARSLSKNYENVNVLLSSLTFSCSILGITETWLNANSPPLFTLEGYKAVRKDRGKGRGGGVLMYISESLSFKIRHDLSLPSESAELLCVEVDLPREKNFIVCIVYRPPHTDIDSFLGDLESLMATINSLNKSACVMGDFNIDLLSRTPNALRFQNILDSNAFNVMIDKPTRISEQSSTLLDNIFVKTDKGYSQSGLFYCEISDHLPVFCMLYDVHTIGTKKKEIAKKRYITEENISCLNDDLKSEDWSSALACNDAEMAYEIF